MKPYIEEKVQVVSSYKIWLSNDLAFDLFGHCPVDDLTKWVDVNIFVKQSFLLKSVEWAPINNGYVMTIGLARHLQSRTGNSLIMRITECCHIPHFWNRTRLKTQTYAKNTKMFEKVQHLYLDKLDK